MKDRAGDPPSRSGYLTLKFICYMTGAVLLVYETHWLKINALLKEIREGCLHYKDGICTRATSDGTPIILPTDYGSCVAMELHNLQVLEKLHDITEYASDEKKEEAWAKYLSVQESMRQLVPLDANLRLLLDRRVIRALFRRPVSSEYYDLCNSAHPKEVVRRSGSFALAILWLSQLPGPDPEFNPDARFRPLDRDDQGLFTLYAREAEADTMSRNTSDYIKVRLSSLPRRSFYIFIIGVFRASSRGPAAKGNKKHGRCKFHAHV